MMLQQRENPQLYEELSHLSDLALTQYPTPEAELERQRQYRSHIEMEAGKYPDALKWLFLAKGYRSDVLTGESIISFLDLICDTEVLGSCRYYLMYYLLIQSEAKLTGDAIADEMYQALCEQKRLLEITGLDMAGKADDSELQEQEEIDMGAIKEGDSGIHYHPDEILNWKYATYLWEDGKVAKALKYYTRATRICFEHKNYETLYVVGFGIAAEKICCLAESGNSKAAKLEYKNLIKQMKAFLKQPRYESVNAIVLEMLNEIQDCRRQDKTIDWRKLRNVSRKISY